MRKDIQYSQFQNYELTYAHFVRFPSWEQLPPGSSPGRMAKVREPVVHEPKPQHSSQISAKIFYKNSNPLFFLLFCSFLSSLLKMIPLPHKPMKICKNEKICKNFEFFKVQTQQLKIVAPIRIWNGSLAISWVTLNLIFQGIKFDFISSQWRDKISW